MKGKGKGKWKGKREKGKGRREGKGKNLCELAHFALTSDKEGSCTSLEQSFLL